MCVIYVGSVLVSPQTWRHTFNFIQVKNLICVMCVSKVLLGNLTYRDTHRLTICRSCMYVQNVVKDSVRAVLWKDILCHTLGRSLTSVLYVVKQYLRNTLSNILSKMSQQTAKYLLELFSVYRGKPLMSEDSKSQTWTPNLLYKEVW
jgi:hypothetical protein